MTTYPKNKKTGFLFLFILNYFGVFSQDSLHLYPSDSLLEPMVYDTADKMPEFPGGEVALVRFLQKKIKYPNKAVENEWQGDVIIKVIITKDGSCTNHTITNCPNDLLCEEAMRVVKLMPKWTPALKNGQPVAVFKNIYVFFKLN